MAALSTQGLVSLRAADWAWTAKLSLQNNFTIAVVRPANVFGVEKPIFYAKIFCQRADELLRTTMPRLLYYLWLAAAGSSLVRNSD